MRHARADGTRASRRHASPCAFEPLERRMLMAITGPAATANSLAALYGGTLVIDQTVAGVSNPRHAVVHVDTQADTGAVAGRLAIDGLGFFRLRGTATNQLVFLVFTGTSGSGTIVARQEAAGDLRGELAGTINGTRVTAHVRLHDQGGTPSSDATGLGTLGAGNTAGGANTAANSGLAGAYTGTVRFQGDALPDVTGSNGSRRRVHAVLNLGVDSQHRGLFDGTFRMDSVGRFQVTGSQFSGNETVLVFTGGAGSGAMVLDNATGGRAAVSGLSGKLFAMIGTADVHGLARLHLRTGTTGTGVAIGTTTTTTGIPSGTTTLVRGTPFVGTTPVNAVGTTPVNAVGTTPVNAVLVTPVNAIVRTPFTIGAIGNLTPIPSTNFTTISPTGFVDTIGTITTSNGMFGFTTDTTGLGGTMLTSTSPFNTLPTTTGSSFSITGSSFNTNLINP
jgi:hypothetical protein